MDLQCSSYDSKTALCYQISVVFETTAPPAIIRESLSQGDESSLDRFSLALLAISLFTRVVSAICSSLLIYMSAARLTRSIKDTRPRMMAHIISSIKQVIVIKD